MSLVRYRTNAYSVPSQYGYREVRVKGYVHEVVIVCGSQVIARHRRSYLREDMVFDPLHYLALLEQKAGALDQAAPLVGWELPECFARLRRLLEARLSKGGKRWTPSSSSPFRRSTRRWGWNWRAASFCCGARTGCCWATPAPEKRTALWPSACRLPTRPSPAFHHRGGDGARAAGSQG
jgi:hypothetical protein